MSKSKKNVIDPETIIKSFGADAARWFVLSDSPQKILIGQNLEYKVHGKSAKKFGTWLTIIKNT